MKHLTQLLQEEHNTKSIVGRGWHFFAGLDPEKNMKILPQCQGLLRPSSIEVQVRVQVLDKKGEVKKCSKRSSTCASTDPYSRSCVMFRYHCQPRPSTSPSSNLFTILHSPHQQPCCCTSPVAPCTVQLALPLSPH